ncbi:MAG TPA: aminodeoxychorismate/anthranilate synthase component II [Candidatus Thermoplasmatota archaeon]|nr:aminodeoxychorismate/anthranilate synthase component II [Candidatus Thermoplasmatota archaeon]
MKVLVLDNYDSFTFNLVQYLGELGVEPVVRRNDAITLDEARRLAPRGVVISPGPGDPANPRDFGVCADVLTKLSPEVPTLGVCLGLQGFAHVYGGKVVRAPRLMHGKASLVHHDGKGVFRGVPSPFKAARYHSLVVDEQSLPSEIEVTARTPEGELMGARHRRFPIEGVQFHPESVLTEHGKRMIGNFLEACR